MTVRTFFLIGAAALGVAACTSSTETPKTAAADSAGGPPVMRRLTAAQYKQTVADVFRFVDQAGRPL